ncbi:hypothetical protein BDV33DRAFT_177779 [Aspergillus novoparasiticus]|uniref:Uncharacterized protein n=1 Tax=Aspergillus novoparasiticus TaxID=986946 RepID=A0A5N6EHA7_9EURO|nr:hypothetical protein BDV33DRAFT_177779 [Aspergillus novoparasiticus]
MGGTQFVVYLAKTHLCYGGCTLGDRDHGLILVSRILLVIIPDYLLLDMYFLFPSGTLSKPG